MSLTVVLVLTVAAVLGLPLHHNRSEHNVTERPELLTTLPEPVLRNNSTNETETGAAGNNSTNETETGAAGNNSTSETETGAAGNNSTNETETGAAGRWNSTWPQTEEGTNMTARIHTGPIYIAPTGGFCPTCAISHLGHSLQTGDEKAGSSTRDPNGNGRK